MDRVEYEKMIVQDLLNLNNNGELNLNLGTNVDRYGHNRKRLI